VAGSRLPEEKPKGSRQHYHPVQIVL